MKRVLVLFALVAAFGLALAHPASANGLGFKTIAGTWSTGLDTTFVADESDSDFVTFDLSDMDWMPFSAGTNVYEAAIVTFTANVSNAAGDSIYWVVQRGTSYYNQVSSTTVTAWENWPAGPTSAAGNVAIVDQGFGGTANVRYVGVLLADPDAAASAINIWGAKMIRLRVQGDQGGTTPKLSGVRCSIRYLSKNPN